ncbi:hypothetical protein [Frankia sp. Cj5]|uniref:hypothetical protein n=1 Tax=Frankia sp. Cj5 TaxID=2880978 RepID=UPI001EF53257|nr:hypothetical protein [Frankia sp. Cj5]
MGGWISGSCSSGPGSGENMAAHLIECQFEAVLTQLELLEDNFAYSRNELGATPLELAALRERLESVTEEVRWMRDQMGKLVGRLEHSRRRQPGVSGPTP